MKRKLLQRVTVSILVVLLIVALLIFIFLHFTIKSAAGRDIIKNSGWKNEIDFPDYWSIDKESISKIDLIRWIMKLEISGEGV